MLDRTSRISRTQFFGIGIYHPKREVNVGSLYRTAASLGATFTFQIGSRFTLQSSNTCQSWKFIPHFVYDSIESWHKAIPYDTVPIAVELTDSAIPLTNYQHPHRAIYVLGAEDHGLNDQILDICRDTIIIPGEFCLNVAIAGSIVIYDRISKLSVS